MHGAAWGTLAAEEGVRVDPMEGPQASPHSCRTLGHLPLQIVSPEPPSRPSISGFSFIFRQVPALLGACSAVNAMHTRHGDTDETKKVKWAVSRLCHPAPESPCHGRLLHAVSAVWSPWLRRALRVCGVVSVSVTQSLCLQHNLCVRGMASVAMTWSLCPWRGSPCQWHGPLGCGTLSVAVVWSPCPWHGGMPMVWSLCP